MFLMPYVATLTYLDLRSVLRSVSRLQLLSCEVLVASVVLSSVCVEAGKISSIRLAGPVCIASLPCCFGGSTSSRWSSSTT